MARSMKPKPVVAVKKVYIVEDHPVFREGLVQVLSHEKDLAVCGEAGSAEVAAREIGRSRPDLVLIDISLPGKSGLDLIRQIRAQNREVKMLVVSMHDEALYADRALRAGADGYIMKDEDFQEILRAVRDVLSGMIYVSEQVLENADKAVAAAAKPSGRSLDKLADDELEILELLGYGKSNPEIARKLGLTTKVVAAHCSKIRTKLKFKSENELIRFAVCWVEAGGQ
jgi:DNA-binding NarL/FixJ family response regulator